MVTRKLKIECNYRNEFNMVLKEFLLTPYDETPPPKKGLRRKFREFLIRRGII